MRATLRVVMIVVCMTLFSTVGFACTCLGGISPALEFKNADAVFVGSVERVVYTPKRIDQGQTTIFGRGTFSVTFKITRALKGVKLGELVLVKTPDLGSACGIDEWGRERTGTEWVVYADRSKEPGKVFFSTFCDRTALLKNAAEDIKYFDSLKK
jgi:hypothetical protein